MGLQTLGLQPGQSQPLSDGLCLHPSTAGSWCAASDGTHRRGFGRRGHLRSRLSSSAKGGRVLQRGEPCPGDAGVVTGVAALGRWGGFAVAWVSWMGSGAGERDALRSASTGAECARLCQKAISSEKGPWCRRSTPRASAGRQPGIAGGVQRPVSGLKKKNRLSCEGFMIYFFEECQNCSSHSRSVVLALLPVLLNYTDSHSTELCCTAMGSDQHRDVILAALCRRRYQPSSLRGSSGGETPWRAVRSGFVGREIRLP